MLTQKIVGTISDAIYHRRLPPGTKLNERDIADLFGVSRTVVRQALIRLSQDGLVEISPSALHLSGGRLSTTRLNSTKCSWCSRVA
ncbi:GntR family transcriptional regulator [Cupriavidus sp. EM10]|uniref:GntR family transcriptional regulator n=1 Tax=Cupriavidus sp. EM10 TaxID=2839983 RepID=UPI00271556FA|nr:GntR family transcriptional regulator [Cupriavidus sp. EM10]